MGNRPYKVSFIKKKILIASLEISTEISDRNFWLEKVAGHGRKKLVQFGILGLEIA